MGIKDFLQFLRSFKIVEKLLEFGRWVGELFEKFWLGIKTFVSEKFKTLSTAFEDISEFFKGLTKWGEESPKGALDDAENVLKDDLKGPKDDPHGPHDKDPHDRDPAKDKVGDEAKRDAAWIASKLALYKSNLEGDSVAELKVDLTLVKSTFPIVKYYKYVPVFEGEDVYMVASPPRRVGRKSNKPKTPFEWKDNASKADLLKDGGQCEKCAYEIQKKVGGDIIHIVDKYGAPRIGKVTTKGGEVITEFFDHFAVKKGDMIYDILTGPKGMNINEYKKLFEEAKYLNFDNVIKP